jgi:hypothetical protein
MNRMAMSNAGSALLRLLSARAGVPRNRILLTEIESVEWRSLTFIGERHQMRLRVSEPESATTVDRMCDGIGECELSAPGLIVVDISVVARSTLADRSTIVTIEALTVNDD